MKMKIIIITQKGGGTNLGKAGARARAALVFFQSGVNISPMSASALVAGRLHHRSLLENTKYPNNKGEICTRRPGVCSNL